MAQQVGDLYPYASGTASLGVEQVRTDGFTTDIRPFGHIHMNSGVWHDPTRGSSGVWRLGISKSAFKTDEPVMMLSTDGGINFPLEFGHTFVNQIDIDMAVPFGTLRIFPSGSLAAFVGDQITLNSNGTISIGTNAATGDINLDAAGGMALSCDLNMNILAGSTLTMQSLGSMLIDAVGSTVISTLGFLDVHADDTIVLEVSSGPIILDAGIGTGSEGNITLKVADSSGQFTYNFGPHQSWYIKTSHSNTGGPYNNGFWPIAHSGNVNEMIQKAVGTIIGGTDSLQLSYNGGRTINTSAAEGGPVAISGIDTYGLQLAQLEGSHPHMIMSGIYAAALSSAVLLPGSLWMQAHTGGVAGQLGANTVSNQDEASAQSLGLPTLFYNTNGSGITSVRVASGIAQGFNVSNSAAIDENGLMIPINLLTTPTTFYTNDSTSGVGILVPGLYKITYTASAEKTAGTLAQSVQAEIRNQDKWGRVFRMLGSRSFAQVRDNAALNRGTANGQWLGDLKAGDHIIVFVNTTEAPPAGNSVRIKSREGNLILEWIGPRGAGEGTLQKVS